MVDPQTLNILLDIALVTEQKKSLSSSNHQAVSHETVLRKIFKKSNYLRSCLGFAAQT